MEDLFPRDELQRLLDEMLDEGYIVVVGEDSEGKPKYRTTAKGCRVLGLPPLPDTPEIGRAHV